MALRTSLIMQQENTVPLRNDDHRYGAISITLHWAGAACVLLMLGTALWAAAASTDQIEGNRLRVHGSFGVLLFVIIGARILWHFVERRPAPLSVNPILRKSASVVHLALLILVGAQLVTGPVDVWSGGWPLGVFDWFAIPSPLGGRPTAWHDLIGDVHRITGFTIAALVSLHFAAALKHLLIDRDHTVQRMLGLATGPVTRK